MDTPENPEEAMNAVLAAEREAEASVKRCSHEAAEHLAQARRQAGNIGARADERIGKLRVACADKNAQQIRTLDEEADPGAETWNEARLRDAMAKAIDLVAARLTAAGGEKA